MSRQKLCLAGKNRISIESLDLLRKAALYDLCVCPVDADHGVDDWQPSLIKYAAGLGVPIVSLEDVYGLNDVVFLSVEFDRIIRPEKFGSAVLLNIHFSLLPAYKGCFTSIWPIYYGEEKTGVTLHYIDSGIDTGEIIDQKDIAIGHDMNARLLYDAYQDAGIELINKYLYRFSHRGELNSIPQTVIGSSYYSRKSLSEISLEINPRATAMQIQKKVRSLWFPEYQTALFNGENISRCDILNERSNRQPGSILADDELSMTISTIDFDVTLYKGNTCSKK